MATNNSSTICTRRQAVKNKLLTAIRTGDYVAGQKLPGGKSLATEYGVSTATVHDVLNDLAREGLVIRRHGSGTYLQRAGENSPLDVYVTSRSASNSLRHVFLRSRLNEKIRQYPRCVNIHDVDAGLRGTDYTNIFQKEIVAFSSSQPVAWQEVDSFDLPFMVDTGFCLDVTERYATWPQVNNVYEVLKNAASKNNRIYGLPEMAFVLGMEYNKDAFEAIGLDPQDAVSSLDGLVRAIEKINRTGQYTHPFWNSEIRVVLMFLLRAFYSNLEQRFNCAAPAPIEQDVAIEVLTLLHRLKWKLNCVLLYPGVSDYQKHAKSTWDDYVSGKIPMIIKPWVGFHDARAYQFPHGFIPCGWGLGQKKFCVHWIRLWVINGRLSPQVCDFAWDFLQGYVAPQTYAYLRLRFAEEGFDYSIVNPFVDDSAFEQMAQEHRETKAKLLGCTEPCIDNHVVVFQEFLRTAQRVLFHEDADIKREYDFYLASVYEQRRDKWTDMISVS